LVIIVDIKSEEYINAMKVWKNYVQRSRLCAGWGFRVPSACKRQPNV
jgi:hypothetical protein